MKITLILISIFIAAVCHSQTAAINYTLKDSSITLYGNGSTGYKSAQWVISGKNKYQEVINSSSLASASGVLPDTGTYVFKLTVFSNADFTGKSATSSLTLVQAYDRITVIPPPAVAVTKTIVSRVYLQGYEYVLYSDGTSTSSK